jgi:hypothetical protein
VTRDPGLQRERTRLAWRRTMLAAAVVAILLLRMALRLGPAGALPAAAVLLGWAACAGIAQRRGGRMIHEPGPAGRAPGAGGRAPGSSSRASGSGGRASGAIGWEQAILAAIVAGYAALGVALVSTSVG